jgi:hypothetical protein
MAARPEVSSSAILRAAKARRQPFKCGYQQRRRQRIARFHDPPPCFRLETLKLVAAHHGVSKQDQSAQASQCAIALRAAIPGRDRAHAGERNRHRRCIIFCAWYCGTERLRFDPGVRKRADCRRWRDHRLVRCGPSLGGILGNPVPEGAHGDAKQTRRQRSIPVRMRKGF